MTVHSQRLDWVSRRKTQMDLGVGITIEFGLRQVDFLDAYFDRSNSVYKQYRKFNDNPIVHSNHPLSTIK